MGNHHSQAAAELGPGGARTLPRERTGRLLSYGKIPALQPPVKVLPDRVPGQKLRISASLPAEGVTARGASPSGDLQRSSPQGRSESRLVREEEEDEEEAAPRTHGSEPDLREAGGRGRGRRIIRGRVSPGDRKLRAPPPPELTLPPPPGEPPPPPPTAELPTAPAGTARRRLFRPHVQRRPAGARPPPAVRAVSEERGGAGDAAGGGRSRARSVDCLQAALRNRGEKEEREERRGSGSLPRRHVQRKMSEERPVETFQEIDDLGGSRATSRSDGALQTTLDWRERRDVTHQPWQERRETAHQPWQERRETAHQPWQERRETAHQPWQERRETTYQPSQERREATHQPWQERSQVIPHHSEEALKPDDWNDHRIKITVGTNDIQVGGGEDSKPKLVYFGMENAPAAGTNLPEEGRMSALTKVKRNEEVSITGSRVSYRRPTEHVSGSASRGSTVSGESAAARATNLQRIPTQKLNDFMSTLERSKRRQLSASRDEILTNSPARSYRSQSSVFDCELQVAKDESISMHLRPSLPKKQQQMPRFSPLAAWKSLHLDEAVRREWRDEPCTKQPLREQLCRHRPIAQSADSGIGGDAGSPPPPSPEATASTGAEATSAELPLAASSPTAPRLGCWTPAQDLEDVSSGDDASLAARDGGQGTLPKLTSRGGMFAGRGESHGAGRRSERGRLADGRSTVGIVSGAGMADRSAKTSDDRPVQSPSVSLDQNWLLSRSVPSSLNADADVVEAPARSDVGVPPTGRHIMYLPEYHSMRVERGRSISPHGRDVAAGLWDAREASAERASPEKPPRSSLPTGRRKFAYQSTLRLIEKKKLETQLSREAEEKEQRRREEQEAMQRVEREFQQKRLREGESVLQRHQLRVLELERTRDGDTAAARPVEHPASSDVTTSGTDSDMGFSSHKESPQSSPRSVSDVPLPQFKLPAPGGAGRANTFWEEPEPECPPPDYNSLPPLLDQHPISLPPPTPLAPPEQPLPPPATAVMTVAPAAAKLERPRLLSGVKNWLRGRREGGRPPGGNMANVRREEPEGEAASSPDRPAGPGAGPGAGPDGWDPVETRWSGFEQRQRRKSASKLAGEPTDGSRGEPAPPSPAGSGAQQLSSGYESSPSLDTSKRLTQELDEYRQERREYRDYRTPVSRYRYRARSPSTPEGLSPSRQDGRKTPTSAYSEPQSKSGRHGRQSSGIPTESQGEVKPSRPVTSHGNYRRAFARGSGGHPVPGPPAAPPERNCRTPNSLAGSEKTRAARTARRLQGFQRSLSHHELHFRSSRPLPARAEECRVGRGRSEERLDAGGPWRLPPLPARVPPHPHLVQRRGYVPRYINNSPARFIHGVEHGLLSPGHRPLVLLPPRPASAFPA